MGWVLFQMGEAEQAFVHAQAAQKLSEALDPSSQALASLVTAWTLSNLGLSDESYSVAQTAIHLAEVGDDNFALALSLHVFALIAWMGGDIPLALETSTRAIAIARSLTDTHVLSWCLFGRGCMVADEAREARERGDDSIYKSGHEEAIDLTEQAIELSRQNSDSWALRVSLTNKAEYCAHIGRFEEAHETLTEWTKVTAHESNRRKIQYLKTYAEILQRENRLEEARRYAEQAVELTTKRGTADLKHVCTKTLSEVHEARGDYEMALQLYKRFHHEAQQFEGEKLKCRARVAEVFFEAEKFRQQAEDARRLAEQSGREALTDALTGVANRRRLEQAFAEFIADGKQFAVVFADLDHFKSINDKYSHAIGDDVIKAFSKILSSCCRDGDIVARIGGEEFILLIKRTQRHNLPLIGERILRRTHNYDWDSITCGLKVTTSIGLACSDEAAGKDALLALADSRVYQAKSAGRNCYVCRPHR